MNILQRITPFATVLVTLLLFPSLSPEQMKSDPPGCTNIPFEKLVNRDIGPLAQPSIIGIANGAFSVTAGGADIWGTRDEFSFSFVELKGDVDVRVRVKSLSATHTYTKAGIMARETLEPGSRHVYYQLFPDNQPRNNNKGGCEFQYRSVEGGEMKAIYPADAVEKADYLVQYPSAYIRLIRKGDVFEGWFSGDGAKWEQYSSFNLKLEKSLFVGLAVTSHDSGKTTTAVFSSFQLCN
jgi:hypothetical protein